MNNMKAINQIIEHIDNHKSFVLEAGAGSGKTYTLIETLNYLINIKGKDIRYNNQKIICITYTNVAKNEIIERLEDNPLVLVSTIHEFLWNSIKSYQKQLKIELCKLNEIRFNEDTTSDMYIQNLLDRIDSIDSIYYDDTAFRDFEKGLLHHDDVIILSKMMFQSNKLLTSILSQKFPYILIDEYQDTSSETIIAFIEFLLERNKNNLVLGFYGDSHQKIYDSGVGDLEKYYNNEKTKVLELVKKEENYRSSKEVVDLLNKFRSNIEQKPQRKIEGSVKFIYCTYNPPRATKVNRKGEIVFDETITNFESRIEPQKNKNYDDVKYKLEVEGWNFKQNSKDKILVIANSRVAKRSGFGNLYTIFSKRYPLNVKEQLLDRNHNLVKYFVGYRDKKTSEEREIGIEHLVYFWQTKNYNEVLRFIKKNSNIIDGKYLEHRHKKIISNIISQLIEIRSNGTIKEVLEFIEEKIILRKTDNLNKFFQRINIDLSTIDDEKENERLVKDKDLYDSLMAIPYQQVINFYEHTQDHTVFSTKHGTKGEEYRNVLTIIDDSEWKKEYNFGNFFNNTDDNERRKLKTRNLSYVECSRAKENLVVLALSEMDEIALDRLKGWFGSKNVLSIEEFIK